jgi:hypothetical protein
MHSKFTYSVFIYFIFFMGPCLGNPDTKVLTTNFKSRLENSVGTKFSCLKGIEKNYGLLVWGLVGGWREPV